MNKFQQNFSFINTKKEHPSHWTDNSVVGAKVFFFVFVCRVLVVVLRYFLKHKKRRATTPVFSLNINTTKEFLNSSKIKKERKSFHKGMILNSMCTFVYHIIDLQINYITKYKKVNHII